MQQITDFKVNSFNPFFTKESWNNSITYSNILVTMFNELLGKKFKGIYNSKTKYDVGDYILFNEQIYKITSEKNEKLDILHQTKTSYIKSFKYKDSIIVLEENGPIKMIKASGTSILMSGTYLDFDLYEDNIIAFNSAKKIIKYNLLDHKQELTNIVFDKNITNLKFDDFRAYFQIGNTIYTGNYLMNDDTEYEELINTSENVYAFDVTDTFAFLLTDSGCKVFNKTTKEITSLSAGVTITNQAKITVIDNNNMFIYGGSNTTVHMIHINENRTLSITPLTNSLFTNVSSISVNESYLTVTTTDDIVTKLSVPYELEKVEDVKSLLYTNLKLNADFNEDINSFFDFTKGQYEYKGIKPISPSNLKNENGYLVINSINKISYEINGSKTVKFKIDNSTNSSKGVIGNVVLNNNKYNINGSSFVGVVDYYLDIDKENNKVSLFQYNGEELVEMKKISGTAFVGTDSINLVSATYEYNLFNLIMFERFLSYNEKDYYVNSNLFTNYIQPSVSSYPNSLVKTDKNGNINLNITDNSILKNESGFRANISSDYKSIKQETDVSFSIKGATAMYKEISELIKLEDGKLALKHHTHNWSDVLDVPRATTSNPGIVQLSNSLTSSSETIAATSKSVQTLNSAKFDKTGGAITGELTVTDTIYCNNNITAFSDKRLKENIERINNALSKVIELNGYTFNMIGNDKRMTGVIAQEIEKVLPEAIEYNEEGYMSVAYGNIVGLLIEAIKMQQKEIDSIRSVIK